MLVCEVLLPKRTQDHVLGSAPAKAQLHLVSDEYGDELLSIPAKVGRAFAKELKTWQPIARNEVLYTLQEFMQRSARKRIEGLISHRDYPAQELSRKLLLDGYPKALVQELVDTCQVHGLLDDQRFAENFIRSKQRAGWGPKKISSELKRKGIDLEFLGDSEALWELLYGASDLFDQALQLVRKKTLTQKNDYQKLMRFLLSRGYSADIAKRASLARLEEENAEEIG